MTEKASCSSPKFSLSVDTSRFGEPRDRPGNVLGEVKLSQLAYQLCFFRHQLWS
jgi:hypothetical protein